MSQAPAMPVWTDALIGDTTFLSAEEFGAYCLLLFATWRNNGQALPDDAAELSQICRMTTVRWRTHMRQKLIRFFDTGDGTWHQKRLEKEWAHVQAKMLANRANGVKGGRPSKNPTAPPGVTQPKPNGSVSINPTQTQHEPNTKAPIPIPISKKEPEASASGEARTRDQERSNGRTQKTRIAADWEPDHVDCGYAKARGWDSGHIGEQAEGFRDYHIEHDSAFKDWHSAWRTWVRRTDEFAAARNGNRGAGYNGRSATQPGPIATAMRAVLSRRDLD